MQRSLAPSTPHPALRRQIARGWKPSIYPAPSKGWLEGAILSVLLTAVVVVAFFLVLGLGSGIGWFVVAITS